MSQTEKRTLTHTDRQTHRHRHRHGHRAWDDEIDMIYHEIKWYNIKLFNREYAIGALSKKAVYKVSYPNFIAWYQYNVL